MPIAPSSSENPGADEDETPFQAAVKRVLVLARSIRPRVVWLWFLAASGYPFLAPQDALGRGASSAPTAATPLEAVRVSPDTTTVLGTVSVEDEGVASDDLGGTVVLLGIGPIPRQADLDAYCALPDGDVLLSFDTTVDLPGAGTVEPGDVVRYDGFLYAIEFDAASEGIRLGANVDAVATYQGALLLSFDVSVDLDGLRVDDEDLVLFDGAAFSLFFDGSAAGVAAGLDLDAAQFLDCNGHLFLSFDGSGAVGGIPFDDEDILEYDLGATWQMAYDGSAHHASWRAADLDAFAVAVDLGPGPPVVFGQTILPDAGGAGFRWPNPVLYKAVRGSFAAPADVGDYVVNLTASGSGTLLHDPSTPASGTGLWYLVKPGGCVLGSWQSTLGAEPGRDSAIP